MDMNKMTLKVALVIAFLLVCLTLTSCMTDQSPSWETPDYNRPPAWEEDFGWPDDFDMRMW
jgi:hypothetical protein